MDARPLRAPDQDGAILAVPPLADVGSLLEANRHALASPVPDLLGQPWSELRRRARQTALAAAGAYLSAFAEPRPDCNSLALVMSGHQPELFHPGVWVKNFALNGLARALGCVPVNLIVDNDTLKSASLRLPGGDFSSDRATSPHLLAMAFDRWLAETPYEERAVNDEDLFASFPQRVRRDWHYQPLLDEYWAEVRLQSPRTPLLGERFAAARRALERRWGCHNLEVPVSRLCQTGPFAWFASHLLLHLPDLHVVYNACVGNYRRRHGLRSRNHPVPDLEAEGEWLEAPFWAWRTGATRRCRLMVRRRPTKLELRVAGESWPELPIPGGDGDARLTAAWQDLERHGYKIRSRALTNTMYARLFLADLFVHGIGGAKYDEVTDAIIRGFYGVEPPGYLVLSATLLLPLPSYPARADDCRLVRQELRDLFYNPQRHLDHRAWSDPAVEALAKHKQWLVQHEPTDSAARRQWFHDLRAATGALRAAVDERVQDAQRRLAELERQVQANDVLRRRDYSFCLYPETLLRPFCTQFLAATCPR
jgi:hypothetical protein